MMTVYSRYQDYKDQIQSNTTTPDIKGGKLTPTTPDIEGPFYLPGAPELVDGVLYPDPDLTIAGAVFDVRTGQQIVGAVLDFWQADVNGVYDEHGMKYRGKIVARKYGTYELRTRRPGDYAISDTEFRCAHIHVKVTAAGFKPLTTQL